MSSTLSNTLEIEPTCEQIQADDPGQTIVEFRELNNFVAGVSSGFALLIYGIVMWQTGMPLKGIWLVVGAIFSAIGVCGAVSLFSHVNDTFRFCENGVEINRYNESQSVTLSNLDGFSFGRTHTYQNGIYTGSTGKMVIDPKRQQQVKVSFSFRKGSEKERRLDAFVDLATHAVATRMLKDIKENGQVPWTGRAIITENGLRVEGRHGQIEEIPFSAICEYQTHNGVFELHRHGSRIMKCNVESSNFLPGLRLVEWLSGHLKIGQTVNDLSAEMQSSREKVYGEEAPLLDGYSLMANDA